MTVTLAVATALMAIVAITARQTAAINANSAASLILSTPRRKCGRVAPSEPWAGLSRTPCRALSLAMFINGTAGLLFAAAGAFISDGHTLAYALSACR